MATDLRVVHLALSPKAASVMMSVISQMDGYVDDDESVILDAIYADIKEQMPKKTTPATKVRKTTKKRR